MKRFKQTTVICIACGAGLLGLVWARKAPTLPGWLLLVLGVAAFAGSKRLKIVGAYSLLLFVFCLGWWRGSIVMNQLRASQALTKQKIIIVGTASSDGQYDSHNQLSFDVQHAFVAETGQPIAGSVLVGGFGGGTVNRGDIVQATGKLRTSRGSHSFTMSFALLSVSPQPQPLIEKVRHEFTAGMYSALPEPLGSFAMGLLIGQRSAIPKDLYDKLSTVGLTHIVAVSGYNLTIIVAAVRKLLGKRSKFQSLIISLGLISLFLIVTGLSASIVRSAMISTLSLLGWYYGRPIKPMVLLLVTALATALWSPFYIWSDIGWYLSFLAFFGILIVAPLVLKRLFWKGAQAEAGAKRVFSPPLIPSIIIETLAAEALTLPFIMFIFGRVSLIGLLANLLIITLVPFAMLASFVAGVAGALVPQVAGWFAYPAHLILLYMVDLVEMLARVPNAIVAVRLPLTALLLLYGSVVLLVIVLWQKGGKSSKLTDEYEERKTIRRPLPARPSVG